MMNSVRSDNESYHSSSMKLARRLSSMIFDGFHDSMDDMDYSSDGYHDYSEGEESFSITRGAETHRSNSTLDGYLSKNQFSSFHSRDRESVHRRLSGATLLTTDLDDTTRREEDPNSRISHNNGDDRNTNNARVSPLWEGREQEDDYVDDDDDDSIVREGRELVGNFVSARLSTFSNNIDTIGRGRLSTFSNNIDTLGRARLSMPQPVVEQRLETFTRNIDTIGLNTISCLTTWQSNMETIAFGYATMVTGKPFGDEKEENRSFNRMHKLMLCA